MARLTLSPGSRNGKLSATPKVPNITASKKFSPKEGPGDNMPEMRNMKRGAQYTDGKRGEGHKVPKFGLGKSSHGTYAKGPSIPVEAHERGSVPTGEHHQASHRAPTSHSEFHKLGSGHWKP